MASSCGERLAIDLISVGNLSEYNQGNNYILTAIEFFSRNVWAKPLKNKEASTLLTALKIIFTEMTFKFYIIKSDIWTEFQNYDSIAWYKENNIKCIFTLPNFPESNGLVENFNKQLGNKF